ncbi:MAG: hypothetical protein ACI882_002281 [Reinekea sp.]|jgi:hypothetical protein
MVRVAGLEPARPLSRKILRKTRSSLTFFYKLLFSFKINRLITILLILTCTLIALLFHFWT